MENSKKHHILSAVFAIVGVCALLCAIFAKAWWHYFSALIMFVLAITSWDDVLEIEDLNNNKQ